MKTLGFIFCLIAQTTFAGLFSDSVAFKGVLNQGITTVAPFDPLEVPGNIVWLSAETGITNSSGNMTNWTDLTGNNNNFTNLDHPTFAPMFTPNVINGKPGLIPNVVELSHENFSMPAESLTMLVASNDFANPNGGGTILYTDSHWFLILNGYPYDFPNGGRVAAKNGGFHIYSVICTNAGFLYYEDGVFLTGFAKTLSSSSGLATITSRTFGSGYNSVDSIWETFYMASNSAIPYRGQLETYFANLYGLPLGYHATNALRVACVGDSITAGVAPDSWPAIAQTLVQATNYLIVNNGYSSRTLTDLQSYAPYEVYPANETTNIVFLWEYINSTPLGAAGIHDAISNYCVGARATGQKVLLGSDFHTNATCQAANALVTNDWQNYADLLVNLNFQSLRDNAHTNCLQGPISISSLTSSGTTATATSTAHGLNSGIGVGISGASPSAYNGIFLITVTDADHFTYTFAGGTSPATGTITAMYSDDIHLTVAGFSIVASNVCAAVTNYVGKP